MQSIAEAVMNQVSELVKEESKRAQKTLEKLKEIAQFQGSHVQA